MNDDVRELFPVTKKYIYLNHAALTPYSTNALQAIESVTKDIAENGEINILNWVGAQEETRAMMAQLVNARPEQIAFVRNTSDGLATIANGMDWREGDNIVSCDIEFPSNIYPWMRLKSRGVNLKLANAKNGRVEAKSLFELTDERTRVITLSWLQYSTGFRSDLRSIGEFCRAHNILFVVDVVQGLGALRLDVEADLVDAFATNTHKHLAGHLGLGLLYLSNRAQSLIEPTVVGWTSVNEWWRCFETDYEYKLDYKPAALKYEPGTPDFVAIYAFRAGLKLILDLGPQQVEEHILGLCDYIHDGFEKLGFNTVRPTQSKQRSPIVCGQHRQHSSPEMAEHLLQHQVICAARCGWLRISPYLYNTKAEIDKVLDLLAHYLKAH